MAFERLKTGTPVLFSWSDKSNILGILVKMGLSDNTIFRAKQEPCVVNLEGCKLERGAMVENESSGVVYGAPQVGRLIHLLVLVCQLRTPREYVHVERGWGAYWNL
jgi:hypothetical protein